MLLFVLSILNIAVVILNFAPNYGIQCVNSLPRNVLTLQPRLFHLCFHYYSKTSVTKHVDHFIMHYVCPFSMELDFMLGASSCGKLRWQAAKIIL